MRTSLSIESLALFGSVPRGDHDGQSDRDILIVSKGGRTQLNVRFVELGYSPSFYSFSQLENLAQDGSLFIQHLKQESRLLIDGNGQLQKLLKSFTPKRDYSNRLDENRSLFEMTKGVPSSDACVNWAFDVLAVAFRNHAILYFAQHRIYEFSYEALVQRFASAFGLSEVEITLLRELRIRKHQYRVHPSRERGCLSALHKTQALLEKIVSVDCFSVESPPQDFIAKLAAIPNDGAHWYHNLRRYEGIYRALGYKPTHDSNSTLRSIEELFAQPSPYSSVGGDSIMWIQTAIKKLRSI